jgi:hypothetical protein
MLCKYKNSLGVPNKGFHKHFLGFAIGDFLVVLILSIILAYYFKWNFILILVSFLLLGIIFHRIFCVNTVVNKFIFGKINK